MNGIGSMLYERYENRNVRAPIGPWLADVHHAAADGYVRTFGLLLPPSLTWGHVIYLSTPMIHREHLHRRRLDRHVVPVLAARDPRVTGATMIVPSALWPPEMREGPGWV